MPRPSMPHRRRTLRIAGLTLAAIGAAVLVFVMTTRRPDRFDLPERHPRAASLHADVEMLAGTIGERNVWEYAALERASGYIVEAFAAAGYDATRHPYQVLGRNVDNIEAVMPGTSIREETVVLGAHYDSVRGSPGANDNGTGVAALLDLARRFAGRPQARTIRFVAFVNEEPPFFQTASMGSLVYATAVRQRGEQVVAMLSLETMGYYSDVPDSQAYPAPIGALYPSTGNFIGFVSNVRSAGLLLRARRAFRSRTTFPLRSAAVPASIPGVGWSDHWAFWQNGYRAMMVTDTALYRYPWYHTAQDTPDKVSPHRLGHVVDGLEQVAVALAGG